MRLSASRLAIVDSVDSLHRNTRGVAETLRPSAALISGFACIGGVLALWKGYRTMRRTTPTGQSSPSAGNLLLKQAMMLLLPSAAQWVATKLTEEARGVAPERPKRRFSFSGAFYRWLGLEK